MRVRRRGATMTLEVELPFTDHDELDVGRVGDELLVRVGPYRRAVVLPDALRRRAVSGARLRDGRLTVTFADATVDGTTVGTATAGAGGAAT